MRDDPEPYIPTLSNVPLRERGLRKSAVYTCAKGVRPKDTKAMTRTLTYWRAQYFFIPYAPPHYFLLLSMRNPPLPSFALHAPVAFTQRTVRSVTFVVKYVRKKNGANSCVYHPMKPIVSPVWTPRTVVQHTPFLAQKRGNRSMPHQQERECKKKKHVRSSSYPRMITCHHLALFPPH